jgi:hypothetical protein
MIRSIGDQIKGSDTDWSVKETANEKVKKNKKVKMKSSLFNGISPEISDIKVKVYATME